MNKGLIKLAEELIFSDWIGEDERATLKSGWEEYKKILKEKREDAEAEAKSGHLRLKRLLGETATLLQFMGDPKYEKVLKGFADLWRDLGNDKIAEALDIRHYEARYSEPEIPDIDWESEETGEEEEPPRTLRSLPEEQQLQLPFSNVAKLLHFSREFNKFARGNK